MNQDEVIRAVDIALSEVGLSLRGPVDFTSEHRHGGPTVFTLTVRATEDGAELAGDPLPPVAMLDAVRASDGFGVQKSVAPAEEHRIEVTFGETAVTIHDEKDGSTTIHYDPSIPTIHRAPRSIDPYRRNDG